MKPSSETASDPETAVPEELRSIFALLIQAAGVSAQAVELLVARAEESLREPPKR